MSLLVDVATVLREGQAPFAVIGAAAMAVHGVSRSTRDLDLLTLEHDCLTRSYWQQLSGTGTDVSIHHGDPDEPLAGVVRFTRTGAAPLDLVVGKSRWQDQVVRAASEAVIEGVSVPVVRSPDLVLLKLFAGGPQDAWDIAQLTAVQVSRNPAWGVRDLLGYWMRSGRGRDQVAGFCCPD